MPEIIGEGDDRMPRLGSIDAVSSDKVRALGRWWQTARGNGALPDRLDFDPAAWKPLLPYLLLTDVNAEPFRVRYRLIGTAVVYVVGFDFTWRYLDEILSPDASEPWIDNYRAAYDSRLPVYGSAIVSTVNGEPFHYDYGIFPMTTGDADIVQCIALEDYGAVQPRVQSTLLDLTIRRTRSDGDV